MPVTDLMRRAVDDLNARWEYQADEWWNDRWTILDDTPARGDCDDYAVTIAWRLSGRSVLEMLRNVMRGRAVFSRCETARGASHLVLGWDGYWTDNIQQKWTATRPHAKHKKLPAIWVVVKLLGPVPPALLLLAALAAMIFR